MSKSFIDTPKFRQHNHHYIIKHLKYKRQNHATSHKYFYTCTFKYLYKVQSMNQIKPQQLSIALTRLTLSFEFLYNKPAVSSIDALNHFGALKIPFLRHIFTTLPKHWSDLKMTWSPVLRFCTSFPVSMTSPTPSFPPTAGKDGFSG